MLASVARSTGRFSEITIIDDHPKSTHVNGLAVMHSREVEFSDESQLIFGVGHNATRYALVQKIKSCYVTLIHSSASVCEYSKLGDGCAVMAKFLPYSIMASLLEAQSASFLAASSFLVPL